MADPAQANGRDFMPPYGIPWKTFENFLTSRVRPLVEADDLPPKIDRSFLGTMGGNSQTYLMSALRTFGLTDQENNVLPALKELAKDEAGLPERVRELWRHHYASVIRSAEAKETQAGLEEVFRGYGPTGDTLRKAISFFVGGAKFSGITLSPHWNVSKGLGAAQRAPRGARKRKPASAQHPAEHTAEPKVDPAVSSRGDTHSVALKSGWQVTVTLEGNMWDLDSEDTEFVLGLVRTLKDYKRGPKGEKAPRKPRKGPDVASESPAENGAGEPDEQEDEP